MKDARWEQLQCDNFNWTDNFGPEFEKVWGLAWAQDPWAFRHRALVGRDDLGHWFLKVWFVTRPDLSKYDHTGHGDFIDQGEYPSKLAAMRAGRNIAKMAHAMNPEPGDTYE